MTAVSDEGPLDLAACRPHEYEGKVVAMGGARYRIGPCLGQGAEKIVHPLINTVSGLTLHVIKIFRDQKEIAKQAAVRERRLTEMRRYFGTSVPDSWMEQSHNGWFEVQDAVGALLPAREPLPADAAHVGGAVAEREGRPAEALRHYLEALRHGPGHTHALVGAARVQALLGRSADALVLHERALLVEPNYCTYYLSLAVLAYEVGVPYRTIQAYEAMKQRFPYRETLDEIAAAAYVSCGEPDEALHIIADSGRDDLDEETVTLIRERATALKEGRQRAAGAWQRASAAVVARDAATTRAALQEALSLNPGDPWLVVNEALSRVQYSLGDAQELLTYALRFLQYHFHGPCRVSLALHAQRAAPDSEQARQLIREVGMDLPTADEESLKHVLPLPAALWFDLDGLQCIDPAATAETLAPAAERAFAATGDPLFRAVSVVYGNPSPDFDAFQEWCGDK